MDDVRLRNGVATILVTMPHRGRPVCNGRVAQGGGRVEEGIRERLRNRKGIRDVVIKFTRNPVGSTARLSDKARTELGLTNIG